MSDLVLLAENAIISIIKSLEKCFTVQKHYTDNGNAVGSLDNLKKLFDSFEKFDFAFGYHITKCQINTKEHLFEKAQQIFANNEVEVVYGCGVHGSVIYSDNAGKKL